MRGRGGGNLLAGAVTLLFSDIEGSTRLLQDLGDPYGELLADHHRLLREVWAAHDGVEVKTDGDSFFVAFSRAAQAVAAAEAAQRTLAAHRWPSERTPRVRMGVHLGTPQIRDDDYWGIDVHYAARLCAAANGGQVLLSESVAHTVDADLDDLGTHALKDFPAPRRIFHLRIDGVGSDRFPPVRTLRAGRTNLPDQISTLIGRGQEAAEVEGLVPSNRLITLTGPGGVGKTRLSLQVGANLLDGSGDGVWLVELAGLADPAWLPGAVAAALSARLDPTADPVDALAREVGARHLLLVLDNCEHVIDPAAQLAEALLRRCANLTIIATSREPLNITGEMIYRVPPLVVPDADALDPATVAKSDSVRLFVERAPAHRPAFVLDENTAADVVAIVRRLDGIPLAIELATPWLRRLSLSELRARLDRGFSLLSGGSRTALGRQRTISALIDWSYDLLTPDEQRLLATLSVFAGGFELDAAEQVCGDVVVPLGALVDKSLVQADDTRGEVRYHLLETVRDYAAEKLREHGEQAVAQGATAHTLHYLAIAEQFMTEPEPATPAAHVERGELRYTGQAHADFLVLLIERFNAALGGREQLTRRALVALEEPNISAALAFANERGDGAVLARLAVAMYQFWEYTGRHRDAERWLRAAIGACVEPSVDRARTLAAIAATAHVLGNEDEARLWGEDALALGERLGDELVVSKACVALARTVVLAADFPSALAYARRGIAAAERAGSWRAVADAKRALGLVYSIAGTREWQGLFEEIAAAFAEHGDMSGFATALANVGSGLLEDDRIEEGRAYLTEALELDRRVGDRYSIAMDLGNLGHAALRAGDLEQARARNEEALTIAQDTGHAMGVTFILNNLADTALAAGDHVTARRWYGECLALARQIGQMDRICLSADGLGALALRDGDAALAVRLLSAGAAARARHGIAPEHRADVANERVLAGCRDQLGAAEFSVQWRAGQTLDLADSRSTMWS